LSTLFTQHAVSRNFHGYNSKLENKSSVDSFRRDLKTLIFSF